MVTNSHTWQNIFSYYMEIKLLFQSEYNYWPPFQAIVTDFCWAQINAILFISNLSPTEYLKLMYEYATGNDQQVFHYVDETLVMVFLCVVHLSKNFLRDINVLRKEMDLTVAKIVFSEIVRAKEYSDVKKTFAKLCDYLLCEDEEEKRLILFDNSLAEEVERISVTIQQDSTFKDDSVIYKNSPFYRDLVAILDEKSNANNQKTDAMDFLQIFLKRYLAYLPMWSAICHRPRSESLKDCVFESNHRFSTAVVEGLWSRYKNDVRTRRVNLGGMPLPVDRAIRFLKDQALGDIVRYQSNVGKTRLAARPGTFKRVQHVPKPMTLYVNPGRSVTSLQSEFTEQQSRAATAVWKRQGRPEASPTTSQAGKQLRVRRLFEQKWDDLYEDSEDDADTH
ncbi:uncharacterized protein LOC129737857 [Uranotaenia lowii]|uniref:uncharacterized protein LOC129737857 n=1 Tax=Uranotaenia lowii TaxID=190385 RepID=UPI00247AA4A3|nr:uncharacterized protein LOC129737857 [Uranotaenia lowii]